VLAEKLAPDVLQHIARLHDQHQENDEQDVAAFVTGNREREQRGSAYAIIAVGGLMRAYAIVLRILYTSNFSLHMRCIFFPEHR